MIKYNFQNVNAQELGRVIRETCGNDYISVNYVKQSSGLSDGYILYPENAGITELELINIINSIDSLGIVLLKAKEKKIIELSEACNSEILSGFTSTAFDGVTEKQYDSEMTDQANINGLSGIAMMRVLGQSTELIKWKASGELECYEWDPESIVQLGIDLKKFKDSRIDKFNSLRIQVLNSTTIKQVEAIIW